MRIIIGMCYALENIPDIVIEREQKRKIKIKQKKQLTPKESPKKKSKPWKSYNRLK